MIETLYIVCFMYFLRFCSSFSGKLKGFIPQIAAKWKKELVHNCGLNTKVKSGLLDPAHRWNFSQMFFEKKSEQESKHNGALQEREQAKICSRYQKKKFKIVWEKFQHRAGSVCC